MPAEVSLASARRIAVAAQGLAAPRPSGRVDARHLRRVFDTVGAVQIDSVNVLVRSQELPLFARLGVHPRSLIPDATDRGELFEYWVHEASHAPTAHHHLHRWRMAQPHKWLRDFATRHGATEQRHLALVEAWLPPAQRSRLLGPWRLAGWLTGALPALCGARAVYATIAAVETFVDRHYQQQIDRLHGRPGHDELRQVLIDCQADERHHRDEAAALAGPPPGPLLRAWGALVGTGSGVAVALASRV